MTGQHFPRVGALLLAVTVAAVLAGGCSALAEVPVPPPVSSTPPPAGVPDAAQDNVSPYPVLERLGRWDGSAFVPVAADAIPAGPVVAMCHGWSPGYLDAWMQLQHDSTDLVTFWDPRLTDPATGQPPAAGFEALAAALQRADPAATVLMFSWIDQSATDLSALAASSPERATEVNGHRFAQALDEALVPDFSAAGGQVHLIGHSFGANVATTAALALDRPPRQLTLFDSPEVDVTRFGGAKNDLRYKLPRLDIGRGPAQTFVDNYVSLVGEPFAGYPGLDGVVDVRLTPPSNDSGGEKHEFAIGWYGDSATTVGSGVGYAWSPLTGADVTGLGASYVQPQADTPLDLTEVKGPPPTGVDDLVGLATTPLVVPGPPDGALVAGDAAPTTNLTFHTDETSLWLTFDLALDGEAGDTALIFVDGRQRFTAAVPDAGSGSDGAFVILYDEAPGEHVLCRSRSPGRHPRPTPRGPPGRS